MSISSTGAAVVVNPTFDEGDEKAAAMLAVADRIRSMVRTIDNRCAEAVLPAHVRDLHTACIAARVDFDLALAIVGITRDHWAVRACPGV